MNFKFFLFYILFIHVNIIYAESNHQESSVFLEYERTPSETQKSNTNNVFAFKKSKIQKNKIIEKINKSDDTPTYIKVVPMSSSCITVDKDENNSKEKLSKKIRLLKERIISNAKLFLGTPYHFGSKSLDQTDCSGLIQQVYGECGIDLPRTAVSQSQRGVSVDLDNLEIGDLLFFCTYKKGPSHVAIYVGNNKMIHASTGAKRVKYDSINKLYYKKRFLFAKRLSLKKYLNTRITPTQ